MVFKSAGARLKLPPPDFCDPAGVQRLRSLTGQKMGGWKTTYWDVSPTSASISAACAS